MRIGETAPCQRRRQARILRENNALFMAYNRLALAQVWRLFWHARDRAGAHLDRIHNAYIGMWVKPKLEDGVMRLQDIKSVSREDLLGLVGLKTKNSLRSWLGGSGLVGIGLAVGATVALLLTPKSGPDIRDSMLDGLRSLRKRAARATSELAH